jgi:hypothetical protein
MKAVGALGRVDSDYATSAGEPDRLFERAMIIARTRGNLAQEARAILLQEGPLVPERLKDELILAIVRARPRSRLIAWHLDDASVLAIVNRVARDLCN